MSPLPVRHLVSVYSSFRIPFQVIRDIVKNLLDAHPEQASEPEYVVISDVDMLHAHRL